MDETTLNKASISLQLDVLLESSHTSPGKKRSTFSTALDKASTGTDYVDVGMKEVYKSLTVLADQVIAKLNEIMATELPDGVASLKPEEHTPEATAQRIADGVTALLPIYAEQHPELEGEELIKSFMETIRGGVKQGYDEAMGILDAIGALSIDGVSQGIEETMRLVEEKLKYFEDKYREEHGLPKRVDTEEEKSQAATEASTTAKKSDEPQSGPMSTGEIIA